jgi:hypothetical protein
VVIFRKIFRKITTCGADHRLRFAATADICR